MEQISSKALLVRVRFHCNYVDALKRVDDTKCNCPIQGMEKLPVIDLLLISLVIYRLVVVHWIFERSSFNIRPDF